MEKGRKIAAQTFSTIRELVTAVNNMNISREDIVSVLHVEQQYWLIYYINLISYGREEANEQFVG